MGVYVILRIFLTLAAMSAFACGAAAQDAKDSAMKRPGHKTRPHIAGQAGPDCCEIYRYVYAEGWYGSEKIVAPVRRTAIGDEVQVPGGFWVHCVFSCEITIRRMHLYYWQDQGAGYVNGLNPNAPRNDFWKDENGRHDYVF
jgi:hypothetical protein